MRLYLWTEQSAERPGVYWTCAETRGEAIEERRFSTRTVGRTVGPLVTVDLPEPGGSEGTGTTKGKRGKT